MSSRTGLTQIVKSSGRTYSWIETCLGGSSGLGELGKPGPNRVRGSPLTAPEALPNISKAIFIVILMRPSAPRT